LQQLRRPVNPRSAPLENQGASDHGGLRPDVELTLDVIQGAIAIRLHFLLDRLFDDWIRKLVKLVMSGIGQKKR
jgi:hypothetical protein